MENILKKFAVAGTHPDRVMGDIGICLCRSKVEHEKPHRVMGSGELQARRDSLIRRRNHIAIEVCRIGICNNHIGAKKLSIGKNRPLGNSFLDMNRTNGCVEFDLDSLPLHKRSEGLCDRSRAAHGKVHAVRTLQVVDQAVDTRRVKRISTNQKRLNGKCLAKLLAGEMTRHHLPDGLVISQPNEPGNLAHHGQEGIKRLRGQLGETHVVNTL